ncbi:Mobilization protein MobD-like protein [Hyella patelloides LEGE 07179]|uniref:Mobilization protein MobD-like protein n=1 Tax=Hyella patelloides LEGE 07179 TaxID=945734 RepID=A0A563VWI2_9CYAN|nr:mobilization protein [Hyella patelloides]VEP15818.1 Mobilization protein MobD-like protein [Hyella patelloides LEGE 07179]
MATIHFIDGEKGGVGKSFVARTMIQYGLDRNLPFVAVETDRSNPDVAGVYNDICQYAVFTEDEKQADKADRIFEMSLEKPVIVSLPSQVHRAMKSWIERNQLLSLGNEYGVSFCKWFVCNGEYDSIRLFMASVDCYGNKMTHILVRNLGLCDEWSPIDEDSSVQELIKKYRVKVIDFPKLGYKERYLINQKRLKFDDAREYKEFGVLGKQRVVNFLKAAYTAFDSAEMWNDESSTLATSC